MGTRTTDAVNRALRAAVHPALLPVAGLLALWWVLPQITPIPAYKLPPLPQVVGAFRDSLLSGVLFPQVLASLTRLAEGFLIVSGLGLAVGFAVATSPVVAMFLEPLATFFQAVAGIAWIPLAIIWFGFGSAPVVFVVANGIFFIVLLNAILGARSTPEVLRNAVQTLGGSPWDVLREVVIPSAFANVMTGLRLGLGFGWKALVAAELIAGGQGLGYMATEAGQRYDSAVVVVCIVVIGFIWLLTDRFLLRPVEARTIRKWGVIHEDTLQ